MDGSGIDFVEADFGSEAAAGGGNVSRSPADWDRWSKQKFRTPLKPFIFMAITFFMLISLPWLLDYVQDLMLANKGQTQSDQAETAETAAPQEAAAPAGQAELSNSAQISIPTSASTDTAQETAVPYQYSEPAPQYSGPVHLSENGRVYAPGYQQGIQAYPQSIQTYPQTVPSYGQPYASPESAYQQSYQRPQRQRVVVSR